MASPAILFEIVALTREVLVEFYAKVFGWPGQGDTGSSFIHFLPAPRSLMGLIAKAIPRRADWSKGVLFTFRLIVWRRHRSRSKQMVEQLW